ncbi:MAG TPA: flippase [Thermoleophilaceae bacterium]|nr:flippase [Thermoleophilaceae bacterium]
MAEAGPPGRVVQGVEVLDTPQAGGKAIRGVAVRTVLFGLGILVTLVTTPLMIRHLGPVDYGFYITVSSIVFIVGTATEAGLTNLGVRHYSTAEPGERNEVLRNLVGLRLVLTGAGVGLGALIALAAGAPSIVVTGVFVFGLGLFLSTVAYTYAVPLNAALRIGTTSALDFLRQALLGVGTVLLVLTGAGLMPFFGLYAGVSLIALAATAALVSRDVSVRPRFDVALWRDFLRETLAYALASAVGVVYFRAAAILMAFISTELETGYFAAPFRIVEIAAVLPWLFVTSAFPIMARAAQLDRGRLNYALGRMVDVGLIVGTWITLSLMVGANFAIDVVAGDDFEPSVGVLRILAPTLVATFVVANLSFALLSLHRHRQLLVSNALAVVVAVLGCFVLIPPLGAEGGAIACTASETVLALAYFWALRRTDPDVKVGWRIVPKLVLAAALAASVILLPVHEAWRVALGTAILFAVLFALRAVPLEVLSALRRRDHRRQG